MVLSHRLVFVVIGCCACLMSLASAQGVPNETHSSRNHASNDTDVGFPDYSQPTTRFVIRGEYLARTRQFGLGESMNRESLGFILR